MSSVLSALNKSIESVTENVLHIETVDRFRMIVLQVIIPLGASAIIVLFLAAVIILICGGVLLRYDHTLMSYAAYRITNLESAE